MSDITRLCRKPETSAPLHEYYIARAEFERAMARKATNCTIAAIHDEMASQYEATAQKIEQSANQAETRAATG